MARAPYLRLLLLVPFFHCNQLAAEVVYDNLAIPHANGFWGGATAEQWVGQQFLLGSNHAVTEVTVEVIRDGSPTGRIAVELWDDSGSGTPGEVVGTVGAIEDLSLIPNAPTQLTFDDAVTGLTPHEPYYVVLSYVEATGTFRDSISWLISDGAPGAPMGDVMVGQATQVGTTNWVSAFPPGFGFPPRFFKMSVTAVPEPQSFVLAAIGIGALVLSRRRQRKRG